MSSFPQEVLDRFREEIFFEYTGELETMYLRFSTSTKKKGPWTNVRRIAGVLEPVEEAAIFENVVFLVEHYRVKFREVLGLGLPLDLYSLKQRKPGSGALSNGTQSFGLT